MKWLIRMTLSRKWSIFCSLWPIKGQSQRKKLWSTFEKPNSPITIGELTHLQLPFDSGQREGINNDAIVIRQLQLTNIAKSINLNGRSQKYENSERLCAVFRDMRNE